MRAEIRISGFGGQGVILAGVIIGRAAALYAGFHATVIQSYGPEARGSHASADVIVSDEPIPSPYVQQPDVLLVFSQEAYARFIPTLKPAGLLIAEGDLVRLQPEPPTPRCFRLSATRVAEELGHRVVLNLVMLGFFAGVEPLLPPRALERALAASVPAEMRELNAQAFRRGFEAGRQARGAAPGPESARDEGPDGGRL